MGGMYVPNIQRPGFGYQRRSEDEEEDNSQWDDGGGGSDTAAPEAAAASSATNSYSPTMSSGSTPASDTGGVQTPDYWPTSIDWMKTFSSQPDQAGNGPLDSGVAPETHPSDDYPSNAGVPGVYDAPMPRPAPLPPPVSPIKQYEPGIQQQTLKAMTERGPKRSILGTIASAAMGAGVGWVNAAGRARPIQMPTQAMRNLSLRDPEGGAWDTKLARQRDLAEQEAGEEKRAQTSQQLQAQEQERMAQADYYKSRGKYDEEQADTNRQYREDQTKNARLQRILQVGGKGGPTETREIPPGGKPPAGPEWYIAPDPLNPGYRIAVRPSRGDEIDAESAKRMHLMPDSEGKFHATPTMINTSLRTQELSEAAAARAQAAATESQRRADQHAEDLDVRKARNAALAGDAADRKARADAVLRDQEQRTSDSIDRARDNLLTSHATWRTNELDKLKRDGPALGKSPEQEEAEIQREWLRRSQSAYDQWGDAIRRRPGHTAADFKFYPNGSVVQTSESYGAGGKPVPVGAGPAPAPAPAVPPTPTGGGRGGGRGGVPPPVQAKTITRARLQTYADQHTGGDVGAAEKVFTDKKYTILP